MLDLSDPVVVGIALWAAPGAFVAAAFLLFGFDRVDSAAHGAYAVRPLLLPGLILLWPLVIWRWIVLSQKGA